MPKSKIKRQGKENFEHKEPISPEDLLLLKNGPVLQLSNPLPLVRNVWFHVMLYWCRQGREGQRSLKQSSFKFKTDEQCKPFVTMTHDEASKNHPDGLHDKPSHEKSSRMYESDSKTDGGKALKLYLSKCNPKCEACDWSEQSEGMQCWFKNRPLGVNTLASMMKQINTDAKLSQVYTNHCVRATAITLWGEAGMPDRQICHISGHKDPNSLRHYHSRPSRAQLRNSSNILSRALAGEDETEQPPQRQLQPLNQVNSTVTSVHSSNQARSSTHGDVLGGMFNSCTIQSVQIYFNSASQNTSQLAHWMLFCQFFSF